MNTAEFTVGPDGRNRWANHNVMGIAALNPSYSHFVGWVEIFAKPNVCHGRYDGFHLHLRRVGLRRVWSLNPSYELPQMPLSRRATSICRLRDDAIVPVICPTCQNVFAGRSKPPAPARYLCMGLFSIFWSGGAPGRPFACLDHDRAAHRAVPRVRHTFAVVTAGPRGRRVVVSAAASSAARSGRDRAPSTAAAAALPSCAAPASGRRAVR